MIQINWQQILAYLLLGGSGIGGLIWGGKTAWTKFRSLPAGTTAIPPGRSADEPAPSGAIDWVKDICQAMGDAPDASKLKALQAGSTRDQARSMRITELEAKP